MTLGSVRALSLAFLLATFATSLFSPTTFADESASDESGSSSSSQTNDDETVILDSFHGKIGQAWLTSLKILAREEERSSQSPEESAFLSSFIKEVYASMEGEECLLAGWVGKITNNRCRAVEDTFTEQREKCRAKSPRAQPCHPGLFGQNVCVVPSDNRWTNACMTAVLKDSGLGTKENFSAQELARLGRAIVQRGGENGINLRDVVFKARNVCDRVVKLNADEADCNRLVETYHAILSQVEVKPALSPARIRPSTKPNEAIHRPNTTGVPFLQHTRPTVAAADIWLRLSSNAKIGVLSEDSAFQSNPPAKGITKVSLPRPSDAAHCGNIDLSPGFGPVRDQGKFGSCYAYSAADLMGYGTPKRFQVSAIATAIAYGHENSRAAPPPDAKTDLRGFSGGKAADAIKAARNLGVCLESTVPSIDGASYDDFYQRMSMLYLKGREEAKKFPGHSSGPMCFTDLDYEVYTLFERALGLSSNALFNLMSNDLFWASNRVRNDVRALILQTKDVNDFLYRAISYVCQVSRSQRKGADVLDSLPRWGTNPRAVPVGATAEKKQLLIDEFGSALKAGVPVEFSHCTRYLIRPKASRSDQVVGDNDCGNHSSIVAGRKYFTPPGKPPGCYYLVRNSWGTEWPKNRAEFNRAFPAYVEETHPGYYWVDESALANHTYRFTRFSKSAPAPASP